MHAALLLESSSVRSASALIFTALATISCAALSASPRISRAVACASAMMRSRSACARASTSAAVSSVFATAKASAVDRSSIRFAVQRHVFCGALLPRRTTKTPPPSTAGIVSVNSAHVLTRHPIEVAGAPAGRVDEPPPHRTSPVRSGKREQGLNRLAASSQLCMPDS
jgi:hypothetical protein